MDFPKLFPPGIYSFQGHREKRSMHVIQSPFATKPKPDSNNNNNNTTTNNTRFGNFNLFNSYTENGEILPQEEEVPYPLVDPPSLDFLMAPPDMDGAPATKSSSYGEPKPRRSPLLLWNSSSSTGLTAKSIHESQLARWYYLANIRTFGFDYLKPPGIPKTLKAMLEEEEYSDAEEASVDFDPELVDEHLGATEGELEEGEEIDEEEDEEEGEEDGERQLVDSDPELDEANARIRQSRRRGQNDSEISETSHYSESRTGLETSGQGRTTANHGEVDLDDEIQEAEEFNYDDSEDDYNENEYEEPFYVADDYEEGEEVVVQDGQQDGESRPQNEALDVNRIVDQVEAGQNNSNIRNAATPSYNNNHIATTSDQWEQTNSDYESFNHTFINNESNHNHQRQRYARQLSSEFASSSIDDSRRRSLLFEDSLESQSDQRLSLSSIPSLLPPPVRQSSSFFDEPIVPTISNSSNNSAIMSTPIASGSSSTTDYLFHNQREAESLSKRKSNGIVRGISSSSSSGAAGRRPSGRFPDSEYSLQAATTSVSDDDDHINNSNDILGTGNNNITGSTDSSALAYQSHNLFYDSKATGSSEESEMSLED